MNGIFWVILITLILDFGVGLFSTILNVLSLKSIPPVELEDVYQGEEYRKSQRYTRVQSLFGLTGSTIKFVLLLTFWLSGGFNYIDQTVRLMEWNEIWNGVAFFGILATFALILNVPLEIGRASCRERV